MYPLRSFILHSTKLFKATGQAWTRCHSKKSFAIGHNFTIISSVIQILSVYATLGDRFTRKNSRRHNSIYNIYTEDKYIEFYFTLDDRITAITRFYLHTCLFFSSLLCLCCCSSLCFSNENPTLSGLRLRKWERRGGDGEHVGDLERRRLDRFFSERRLDEDFRGSEDFDEEEELRRRRIRRPEKRLTG